jgi:hypothetical protein
MVFSGFEYSCGEIVMSVKLAGALIAFEIFRGLKGGLRASSLFATTEA